MKKFSVTKLTFALLVCALAPCARAQAQAAKGGAGVVRERRATAQPSKDERVQTQDATASASKDESKDKPQGEASAKGESAKSEAGPKEEGAAEKDEVEELRAQLASATNAPERARLQRALADKLAESGRRAEAVELLRSMLAEDRFDPPFFYNAGNALARLGESETAIEAYRKAVAQRHGNYSRAQHNLGVVLMRLGRWEEAEEALTSALKQENYTYAEASYSLGRLHALRGEAGLAIAEWRRTLSIEPTHAGAAVALSRALAEDGDPQAALAVLDDFGARLSRRGAGVPREVTVARGEIVAAANVEGDAGRGVVSAEEKESKGDASKGLKASGAESEGISAARSGGGRESSPARESRQPSAGRLRPLVIGHETYDFLRRAREAREGSRGEEAVTLYRRAIESNGGYFAPANLELGFTLAALQRTQEAVASLLAVTGREPARYPIAFYHLGRYYEHLGELEQADAAFARAAELLGGESPQFFADLSRVREREGKYVDALAAAEQYVSAMERAGAAPAWARERVALLHKKLASAPQTPKN